MKNSRITVVGSNMVDLVTRIYRMPQEGETVAARDFEMGFGGKGANQAVAAARMGADVAMITAVGDDIFGPGTLDNLRQSGVNTDFSKVVEGESSGVAPIFVDEQGQNRILIAKGANAHLGSGDVEKAGSLISESNLVILQLEVELETVYFTLRFCRERQIPVILNPAPADPNLDLNKLEGLDFLIPNETELESLTGMPCSNVPEIEAAARTLIDRGIKNVIATMGGNGSLFVSRQDVVPVPPIDIQPVDTTGAGDAFIGSFAACFGDSGDIVESMKTASRFSGLSTTKSGTQKSFPSLEELED